MECSLCCEDYDSQGRKPLIFPTCGHSHCLSCVAKMVNLKGGDDRSTVKIECPSCRKPCELKSPADLPVNFAVLSCLAAKALSSTSVQAQTPPPSSGVTATAVPSPAAPDLSQLMMGLQGLGLGQAQAQAAPSPQLAQMQMFQQALQAGSLAFMTALMGGGALSLNLPLGLPLQGAPTPPSIPAELAANPLTAVGLSITQLQAQLQALQLQAQAQASSGSLPAPTPVKAEIVQQPSREVPVAQEPASVPPPAQEPTPIARPTPISAETPASLSSSSRTPVTPPPPSAAPLPRTLQSTSSPNLASVLSCAQAVPMELFCWVKLNPSAARLGVMLRVGPLKEIEQVGCVKRIGYGVKTGQVEVQTQDRLRGWYDVRDLIVVAPPGPPPFVRDYKARPKVFFRVGMEVRLAGPRHPKSEGPLRTQGEVGVVTALEYEDFRPVRAVVETGDGTRGVHRLHELEDASPTAQAPPRPATLSEFLPSDLGDKGEWEDWVEYS